VIEMILTVKVLLILAAFVTGVMSATGRTPVWIPLMLVILVLMLMLLPKG